MQYWLEIKKAPSKELKAIHAELLKAHQKKCKQVVGPFCWAGLEISERPLCLDHYEGAASRWDLRDYDLCGLSAKYPSLLFVLYGKGECDEDRWVAYYRGGRVQHEIAAVAIRYPKFNHRKLGVPEAIL